MSRYRVTYVGDDGRDHTRIVWAKDHKAAIAKVKADDAEFVTDIDKAMSPWLIAVIWLGIVVLIVFQLCA